ncbi:MAG: hemolysin family protein [Mobilicoccus sp.]|nr:hemolysin family protein [Mobilicoccus sp.]
MSTGASLVVLVVLLALNAFFVGAEFALVSARRAQIEPKAATGSLPARLTLRSMERVSLSMAACQLGITMCSLGIGAVGEPAVAHILEVPFAAIGIPEAFVHPVALVIALAIVVYLHMVLGEMVPKNIALAGPDRAALVLGPPLYLLTVVFRPVIWLMNATANLVLRAARIEPKDEVASAFTTEQLKHFVAESGREGHLDSDEMALLQGALEFETLTARHVTIPADELVTVSRDVTVAEVEALAGRTGFSRFPVLEDGELTGYVHLKDLLATEEEHREQPVPSSAVHDLGRVGADDRLRTVIVDMQRAHQHLALVDGMPGGGVVALEDVLESLVGEVRDATRVGPPR